jgi:hypothetical protein
MKKIFVLFALVLSVCLFGCNAQKKSDIVIPEEFRGKWYDGWEIRQNYFDETYTKKITCEIFKDKVSFYYLKKFSENNPVENAQINYFVGKSFYPVSLEVVENNNVLLFELPDFYKIYDVLLDFDESDSSEFTEALLKFELLPDNFLRMSIKTLDSWSSYPSFIKGEK